MLLLLLFSFCSEAKVGLSPGMKITQNKVKADSQTHSLPVPNVYLSKKKKKKKSAFPDSGRYPEWPVPTNSLG